ncbi:type 12 methyltransferase [Salmonella enterica subsp. indica]|uniref:Type 12 methyltransferase n=1 Tax=Salmonella enterica subsp. indica TaxID=59207 RepID=A0A379YLP1_SALER|nr:type 12 methyltransferase [Salmonella enterica subsp. indica]
MKINTDDGAKVYTPLTLKLYDWWVLGVSNQLAWRCPTREYLLPHFLEYLGNNHLDIWCWNRVLPYSRNRKWSDISDGFE